MGATTRPRALITGSRACSSPSRQRAHPSSIAGPPQSVRANHRPRRASTILPATTRASVACSSTVFASSCPLGRRRRALIFPSPIAELLAYVGDQISYAQDAAATEAYPGTALHRISLRRHARLRDYRMHEGCNARVWVQMDVEPGGAADGALLRVGTQFFAGSNDQLALAQAGDFDRLDPDRSAIFESMEPLTVRAAHNRFELYTWSDDECTLCQGARSATLRRTLGTALEPGMILVLEEVRDPRSTLEGRTDRRWALRLTDVTEVEDPLDGTPLYEIAWAEEDALPFPFVISRRVDDLLVENISVARGNVVLADHGLTVQDDPLDPSLRPRQAPDRRLRVPAGAL